MNLRNAISLMMTIIMILSVYGGLSPSSGAELPSGTSPYSEHIVSGISPNGTTINLFDYWITGQEDADDSNGEGYGFINQGINAGHALLFGSSVGNYEDSYGNKILGDWNCWTESNTPETGIVGDRLQDGFPQLNVNTGSDSLYDDFKGRNGVESLAYLFDPDIASEGKASYEDVKGLLQVDSDGYYYYNSLENYAVYYNDNNSFTLYDYPGVMAGGADQSLNGQFFPFNEATANAESFQCPDGQEYTLMNGVTSVDTSLNHYFGMHMSTRFIQQNGGYLDEDKTTPATYEFSGDDDVWIFIDGILVADLGGIHDKASVKIDFSNGEIYINDNKQSQTLGSVLGTGSGTLTDNTYHTLDFFYMERGNVDSNMELKYNLVTIPESNLIKLDQIGDPVEGAEFTLYAADDYEKNNTDAEALATGRTDKDGGFVFLKTDESGNDYPITIDELYNRYKNSEDSAGNNLILAETVTPPGYRSVGDIGLYFYKSPASEGVLLLSNSIWDKGAYAMPKVTTTTANEIDLLETATGDKVDKTISLVGNDAEENPLMFAVVYQKQKDGTWLPVSGNPLNGWVVEEDSSWTSVLKAVQANPYIFQLASSGAYQVEVSNLPGDIKTYYHIVGNEDYAKYTVAYYYTSADALRNASAENTWRIDSESGTNPMERVFSMDLYVTNIKNQLIVQKVDDEGNTVNGAEFSLYKEEDVTITGNTVTVDDNAVAYDSLTTENITGVFNLAGGGLFPSGSNILENGEYYLIETSAPGGYKLNDTAVHVVIDDTGVYADAGTTDDGVTVLRGVGSVMKSMLQFAADDVVDTTLQDIKAAMASEVTFEGYDDNGSFAVSGDGINWDSEESDILHLRYANENSMLDYGLYDTSVEGTIDNLTLSTEAGWSKLLIQQCYQHDDTVDVSLKTNLENAGYDDITGLFSGTVTVRVTNDKTGNLKISKTVTGDGAPDKEFTFDITLREGNKAVSGSYAVKKGTSDSTVTFDAEGKAQVKLKADESLTIFGLPEGAEYTVEETDIPEGFTADVTVTGNGTKDKDNAAKVSGTIQHDTEADAAVEIVYTNSFDGSTAAVLSGTKTLEGRDIASGEKYSFTVSAGDDITSRDINEGKIIMPEKTEAEAEGSGKANTADFSFGNIVFKSEGTYTFNITENLPEGVTEDDPVSEGIVYDTHTTMVTVTVSQNEDSMLAANVVYDNGSVSEVTDKAVFVNTYETTGGNGESADPNNGSQDGAASSLDDTIRTGDESNPLLWMGICLIAMIGIVMVILLNGRKRIK